MMRTIHRCLGHQRSHHPGQTTHLGGGLHNDQAFRGRAETDRIPHQSSKLFHQRYGRCFSGSTNVTTSSSLTLSGKEPTKVGTSRRPSRQAAGDMHVLPATQHDPLGLQDVLSTSHHQHRRSGRFGNEACPRERGFPYTGNLQRDQRNPQPVQTCSRRQR